MGSNAVLICRRLQAGGAEDTAADPGGFPVQTQLY